MIMFKQDKGFVRVMNVTMCGNNTGVFMVMKMRSMMWNRNAL